MSLAEQDCALCAATLKAPESCAPALVETFIEDRRLWLCRDHHALVRGALPRSLQALALALRLPAIERRLHSRRSDCDRRLFPRPEMRRMGAGRRATDPAD